MKYPPLTTAALVSYNNLGPFSEVVPAEKMAELEKLLQRANMEIYNLREKLNAGEGDTW